MKRLPALLLVALALGRAAAPSHSATSVSAQRFRITVYFLTDEQSAPLGVRRTAVRHGFAALARLALPRLLGALRSFVRGAHTRTSAQRDTRIRSFCLLK
jgi:protein required for attachment to host cells